MHIQVGKEKKETKKDPKSPDPRNQLGHDASCKREMEFKMVCFIKLSYRYLFML